MHFFSGSAEINIAGVRFSPQQKSSEVHGAIALKILFAISCFNGEGDIPVGGDFGSIMDVNNVAPQSSRTRLKGLRGATGFLIFPSKRILYVPYTKRHYISMLGILSMFQKKSPHTNVTLCLLCIL